MSTSPAAPGSPYLPASATGCRYCFHPDNATIRRALTEAPDAALDPGRLADDIAWYHRLLQRHYAGYIDLLHHPALDVTEFFTDWEARIRSHAGDIGLRDALAERLIELQQALPDGHRVFPALAIADERVVVHEYQAELGPRVHAAGIQGVRTAPLLRPDGSLVTAATVSATGPGEVRQAGPLRLRRRLPPARPADGPVYEWRTFGDTAVITLRRFGGPPPARKRLERFPADYPLHARHATILFDLRGNGGGSLEYTARWLAQALGGEFRRQTLLDFAPCACGAWNRLVETQVRGGTVDAAEARAEREDALAAMRAEWVGRPAVARLELRTPGAVGPAGPPYGGRVFVLIDRRTGSSGELTAWELRCNVGAVLVGERSGGGLQYGELCSYVLPATGLLCRIPTRRFFYDGEVEGVGLPVDVYLEDAAMGAEAVVAHLHAIAAACATA